MTRSRTRIAVVDSFTDHAFSGNPAGVCLLSEPASPDWMQAVAAEMRHSETAFLVPIKDDKKVYARWLISHLADELKGARYLLRWFTPTSEVELCGHATLASAHLLRDEGLVSPDEPIHFATQSGRLTVEPEGDRLRMDFPATEVTPTEMDARVSDILDLEPRFLGRSKFDCFVEVADANAVRDVLPDLQGIERLGVRGMVVTAPGDDGFDVVSRFFAPGVGVPEDPVTGSAHCAIGPYWAAKLGKEELRCFQASARGGMMKVRVKGDRVDLIGRAVTVLTGELREQASAE